MRGKDIYLKWVVSFILAVLFIFSSNVFAGTQYKWTDEKGTLHFSDRLSNIPGKYRKQVQAFDLGKKEEIASEPHPHKGSNILKETTTEGIEESKAEKEAVKREIKSYEVPYEPYEGMSRRVIINVKFNNSVVAPMLLDTGSPGLVIFPDLAERLGLFDKKRNNMLVKIGGIGGSTYAIRTIIDKVQVGEAKEEFIPAHITTAISDAYDGLIGMDFMANYSMVIKTSEKVLLLEEDPVSKEMPGGRSKIWWERNFKEFIAHKSYWEEEKKYFKGQLNKSISKHTRRQHLANVKEFVNQQYEESERLLWKLNRYAIKYYVPLHWRR